MAKEPILILTHNAWGEELVKSVRLIAGEIENVYEVGLYAEDSLTDYLERVVKKIKTLTWQKQLLILTDIKGGTPSNVALRLTKDYEVVILSGLCTAMLLEAVMRQENGGFTREDVEEIRHSVVESCQIIEIPKN